jgi:uncharacterized membrane protein
MRTGGKDAAGARPPGGDGPSEGPPELSATTDDRPTDPGLTRALSRLLLTGLLLAVGLMIVGAILAAIQGSGEILHSSSIDDFPRLLADGNPTGFLDLGLLVLLATPAARVLALLVAFSRRRQWLFAGISAVVMTILVLSAILGLKLG